MIGRYASRGPEAEFEPGSRGRVLRNLLGIRSAREMARAESRALLVAQEQLVERFSPDHRTGTGKRAYIAAIHAAMGSDYEPMVRLFSGAIRRALDRYAKRDRR